MDKKIIRFNRIPVVWGFVVDEKFVTFCDYCRAWHFYRVNDDVKDGYAALRNAECRSKRSPFCGKVIKIVKIAKVPKKLSSFCPTEEDVKKYLDNEKYI